MLPQFYIISACLTGLVWEPNTFEENQANDIVAFKEYTTSSIDSPVWDVMNEKYSLSHDFEYSKWPFCFLIILTNQNVTSCHLVV